VEEESSTVIFKGALRLTGMEDYAPIFELLKATLTNEPAPVLLDLRELHFLNSSGITMFSRFVIEARDRAGVVLEFIASLGALARPFGQAPKGGPSKGMAGAGVGWDSQGCWSWEFGQEPSESRRGV
jgi:hypothetical protein